MITNLKNPKFWRKQAKDALIIFAVSVPSAFMACQSCFLDPVRLARLLSINFAIWLIMWKGNEFTVDLVNRYYSWLEEPVKRLIAGVVGHTLFTVIAILALFHVFRSLLGINIGGLQQTLIVSIIAALLISLVLHSILFLQSWKKVAVESERMKKEMISSRYETLKSQVNPHFLFNSLNALSNLVYEDQDQAVKFIKKLSDVYRYVLESRDKDLVDLKTELRLAESYLFLQKIRYANSLQVSVKSSDTENSKIPPLSLQMLLENAIKHNVISEDEPLKIEIFEKDGYLMVLNNLQKKNVIKSESSEVGLTNIRERYSFLTDKPVIIRDTEGKFTVGLPLLSDQ